MRTALVRRAVLTASAASLALLATACTSSGEAGPKADAKASAKPSPSASPTPEAKALTAAELEKATLADGDVPKVKIEKAGADDVAKAAEVSSDKPECQPIALVGSLAPVGKPVTTTERVGATEPTDPTNLLSMTITAVQLQSYDGKGAEEALASLKTAGQACAGGFVVTAKGEKTTIKSLVPATDAAGDDSVAWTVTMVQDGETMNSRLVVLRKGNNLASIQQVKFEGKAQTPQDFIDAQLKKLG
ncbi:hypothetical protein MTF65_19200 [Streptomyces sp. APSN-46.1]|uniref:hypothetical protein n=1 Tax=Streptomyces sp. APSN-46.1 TaxID=2929049 RepID=UPI001FB25BE6|nr:hypothetical protein [Streptomyces sp. APSN-46.1]MCJ1679429.1 hypothetical protein [Streptomyces sp. APSN-46.1]